MDVGKIVKYCLIGAGIGLIKAIIDIKSSGGDVDPDTLIKDSTSSIMDSVTADIKNEVRKRLQ